MRFIHPLTAGNKRETSFSLKLNQTSLAQTKIYRHRVSLAGTDQACIALPPSLPVLHPSKSAAQGQMFPGKCWPALGPHLPPTQSQLGARLKVPPGIGVCLGHTPVPAERSPCHRIQRDLWSTLESFPQTWSLGQDPGIHQEVFNPSQLSAATKRSRGAASSRRWGCW